MLEDVVLHPKSGNYQKGTNGFTEDEVVKLLEKVKNNENLSKEALTELLKSQHALKYFKYNVDQYCELHRLLITEINDVGEYITFLKDQYTFQKVIRERDQFYGSFFEIVVPTLIDVCVRFQESEQVFEETSKIVQKCAFSGNYKEFDCYLRDLFEKNKCPEKHSVCKTVLRFIPVLYLKNDTSSIGFKLIFSSFSQTNKNFNNVFKLLEILIEMIGFDIKNEFNFKLKYQVQSPLLNTSLSILSQLLDAVAKTKIDLECKINDISFTDFIRNLLKSIIAITKVPNIHCYQILIKVVEINPLIIESIISEILIYTMLSDSGYCKEYEQLMIKIFELFTKLHRIQNLISKMIPTLKSGIEKRELNEGVYSFKGESGIEVDTTLSYSVDNILPKSVLQYFTNCIINLASWQVINLLKTLLFHLNKAVEDLCENKGEDIYVEILSTLTCWVLLSVRMAEHTVAPSTVVKFVGGLEELKCMLGKFGRALLQREHNHVLMRAFLNISYYWAEMYMALEYYSVTNDIKLIKNIDNNFSSCNLRYLHSYLDDKEWCLISERINNFGEKPCKEIMQKLMIQKLRAVFLFNDSNNEEIAASIIRTLATDFEESFSEIYTDRFVVNNILDKMPTSVIINLSEIILKDLIESNAEIFKQPHVYDCQLITNGILCVVFTKIGKLLRQKRKHDDTTVKKALCSRVISLLPTEMFLVMDIGQYLGKAAEIVTENNELVIDLSNKIEPYLNVLKQLPIIFGNEHTQKLIILLLFSLLKDINRSNCEDLKKTCESLIISIIQHNKFTLLDLFEADVFIKLLIDNVARCEDIFLHIVQNIFKCDTGIAQFESGIVFIKDNLKSNEGLRFAVIVLNTLNKMKKIKISPESKEVCMRYKSLICHKIVKMILKKGPEDRFIEPYALVLKTFLAKDEDDTLTKVKTCLNVYSEYCLSNLSDVNIKGCMLLFTTILHNKMLLSDFKQDFILDIYNTVKNATVTSEILDDYSQLIILVTSLIPNEQFSQIFGNLLKTTEKSIDLVDDQELCKHLKTWTCILSTNFNPTKTNILREQLEYLLEKLVLMLKCVDYREDLFEEVIQFEVSVIQANHVPLTAAIMDYTLLSVSILSMKKSHDFIHSFNCGITLLENLLKYRNPLIMDRLPPYLLQYRVLLKELCLKSSSNVMLETSEVQRIADCAHKLERLTKSLVDCTKDMARIAMYLIADILGQYELDTLYPNVKKHLNNCIYSLMALCDQHAVQYLMRVLSNASTEIFKIMYENYKKHYRFTGKI